MSKEEQSKHYQITDDEARLLLEALDFFNKHSLDAGPCKAESSLMRRLVAQVAKSLKGNLESNV